MQLPSSKDEIEANWLTSALALRFPGTVVTHATIGAVMHGTATKVRLLLDYNDAGHAYGLPPTMWFKGGLEVHSIGEQMKRVYATEAEFYSDLAPTLRMTLPKCFFSWIDPQTGVSAILLEDMLGQNARFGHATRPASPALARSVLREFAELHGSHWNDTSLLSKPLLAGGGAMLADFLKTYSFTPANWARCLALPRGRTVTGELADLDRMNALVQSMLADDRARGRSLVHGDAHHGNVCILPGECASFLDWQTVMTGFWAHDISYYLTAAMTVEDRRAHERDLIAGYVRDLVKAGGSLDEETAWWEYRRHALYTFCWFPCNPEWSPEIVTQTNTERAVAAMLDLDTLGCWKN